jgi:hypothetical protein
MPDIKEITVKVTYSVKLYGVTASSKTVKQLEKAAKMRHEIELETTLDFTNARDWIEDNICEDDCFKWQAEVVHFKK